VIKFTRTAHYISKSIGRAIGDYDMISEGDKILVGLSGGKDSLTLLKLLRERQRWSPVKYELLACHVRTDASYTEQARIRALKKLCGDMGVKCLFKKIRLLAEDKKISCFWCSWNRRKTLFETAAKLGCRKVALGHQKDDIAETTLLNILFHGEFSSMKPRQELFRGEIIIIRPLCYVEESHTRRLAKEERFPSVSCKCPQMEDSKRQYIKSFIRELERKYPYVKTNITKSITRVKEDYLSYRPKKPQATRLPSCKKK